MIPRENDPLRPFCVFIDFSDTQMHFSMIGESVHIIDQNVHSYTR
jgi:hypothetical protein